MICLFQYEPPADPSQVDILMGDIMMVPEDACRSIMDYRHKLQGKDGIDNAAVDEICQKYQ